MKSKRVPMRSRARDEVFDAASANTEMTAKLRRNSLRRRANAQGLRLRHSDYGYSLVESGGKRIGNRSDLTLDEIDAALATRIGNGDVES